MKKQRKHYTPHGQAPTERRLPVLALVSAFLSRDDDH